MTDRRRLARRSLLPIQAIGLIALVALVAACGPAAGATTRPSPSNRSSPSSSALSPVPGSASSAPASALPATTDTTFGRIFDALPPSFPRLPGQEPADDAAAGPSSGSFVTKLTVAAASATIRAALTAQGWTVDAGSPLEDGSVVLEAVGASAGCKTEVRFTPLSGTVIMSVLYGASCPFG